MEKNTYDKLYEWDRLEELASKFLPRLVESQMTVEDQKIINDFPKEEKLELEKIGFSEDGRDPEELIDFLIDSVYPYRMKANHPRYFCFIPNATSPYSVLGDFINSIYNPFGGGYSISGATATLEEETLKWMGEKVGYDRDSLGGVFVSGGSMANLTASVIARDNKLKPEEITKATVYVSDQTHSSVAKGIHIMGVPRANVRKIRSDHKFRMDTEDLIRNIEDDLKQGYKPFLLVGSCGTTNTGSIDPLEELAEIKDRYNMWYHIDGAYGASALLSSHSHLLKGVEKSDSLSWDGHKWLFQTYGCATLLCKNKRHMIESFSVDPEYLKDVESTEEEINYWDMGIELTKPVRGMRLWFTLQTVGTEAFRDAIDHGFKVADWFEEEVAKYDNFEIVSHSNLGIINFRFVSEEFTEEELDEINHKLSRKGVDKNFAAYLTTELDGKIVLRFCCNSPYTTREDVRIIIDDLQTWIKEEIESRK